MKQILIVEDDNLLNKTLAYNLASDGYGTVSYTHLDVYKRQLISAPPDRFNIIMKRMRAQLRPDFPDVLHNSIAAAFTVNTPDGFIDTFPPENLPLIQRKKLHDIKLPF